MDHFFKDLSRAFVYQTEFFFKNAGLMLNKTDLEHGTWHKYKNFCMRQRFILRKIC